MRRALAIGVVGVMLALAGQAHGRPVIPAPQHYGKAIPASWIARAHVAQYVARVLPIYLADAERYWQQQPACEVRFRFDQPKPPDYRGDLMAWAYPATCLINFTRGALSGYYLLSQPLTARAACWMVAHEYGHLLGFGHATDPTAVMYPNYTGRNVPPTCPRG